MFKHITQKQSAGPINYYGKDKAMTRVNKLIKKGTAKRGRKITKDETAGADKKYTSYDTGREETSTPQKVREGNEPEAEQKRMNLAKGKEQDLENRGSD